MTSKFSEAVRQLLVAETLRCPNPECRAENTVGPGGIHITVDESGLAVCHVCLEEWRPGLEVA